MLYFENIWEISFRKSEMYLEARIITRKTTVYRIYCEFSLITNTIRVHRPSRCQSSWFWSRLYNDNVATLLAPNRAVNLLEVDGMENDTEMADNGNKYPNGTVLFWHSNCSIQCSFCCWIWLLDKDWNVSDVFGIGGFS